jgi:hypothetical protein
MAYSSLCERSNAIHLAQIPGYAQKTFKSGCPATDGRLLINANSAYGAMDLEHLTDGDERRKANKLVI